MGPEDQSSYQPELKYKYKCENQPEYQLNGKLFLNT